MQMVTDLKNLITDLAQVAFSQPNLEFEAGLAFHTLRGFDSAQAVQFILALEDKLNISFSEEDIDNMLTMGSVFETISTKRANSC